MFLWRLVNSLTEKAKDTVLSGDGREFRVGRMQLPKAASCRSASTEIGRYACCWYLMCLCLLCLGAFLDRVSLEYLVLRHLIEIGYMTNLSFPFALNRLFARTQKVLKGS